MEPSKKSKLEEGEEEGEEEVPVAGVKEKEACKFFVVKKNRGCRMSRLAGQEYCAEHVPTVKVIDPDAIMAGAVVEGKSVLERTPCPLDPKHTVAIAKLKKHLLKCNSRPPDNKDYYQASANSKFKADDKDELSIFTMTEDEKLKIIMDLIKFHQDNVPRIENHFGMQEHLMSDFVRTDVGESALRHSAQISSITKLLENHGLLKDSTCFIEYGSGRGGLSFGLARVIKAKGLKNCKFILIDRTSPRYKKDNRARTSEFKEVSIQRIKISIEDLIVGKLPGISNYNHIVGVTKHLCGSGTDVALRSLLEAKSNSERNKVRGLVFATCCHHRIEYLDFVGNEYLTSELSGGNFRPLRQIAAWATNGDYNSSFIKDYFFVSETTLKFLLEAEKIYTEIRLKKTMGRLVKELIDYLRTKYITSTCEDLNLTCKLVNYVDLTTTRENVAILAYPKEN